MSPIVVVSGASGYIAQHIIEKLLQQHYTVVGTVRSTEKAEKLLSLFKNDNLTLEVVPDIAAENAFDELFKKYTNQVKYVLHAASPLAFKVADVEKDLLLPAVNGTRSILESIRKYGAKSVERVVVTSSLTATSNPAMLFDSEYSINETCWNPDTFEVAKAGNAQVGYFASKALAERAAWDFVEEHRDELKFELTTVNPGLVFGPQLFDESVKNGVNLSCESINNVIGSKIGDEVDKNFGGPFIDVRDVATVHVNFLDDPKTASKRLLLTEGLFTMQDVVDIVNERFPELKGKIAEGQPGSGKDIVKKFCSCDNSETRKLLGFDFIPLEKSVVDTVAQILRTRPTK